MATPVLTYAEFIADGRFSAWSEAPQTLIQPAVDAAHRMWSQQMCGSLYKDVVIYQTAVLLASGFGGAPASKTRNSNDTPYDRILEQLTRGCIGSGMVLNTGG